MSVRHFTAQDASGTSISIAKYLSATSLTPQRVRR
jgi:hypothetical protein